MSVKSVSKMSVKYPKVKSDNKQRFYVVFYDNGKRYRLFMCGGLQPPLLKL